MISVVKKIKMIFIFWIKKNAFLTKL